MKEMLALILSLYISRLIPVGEEINHTERNIIQDNWHDRIYLRPLGGEKVHHI